MVVLLSERLGHFSQKLHQKLDNHLHRIYHHHPESAAVGAFRADVSDRLHGLLQELKMGGSGSEGVPASSISLSWFSRCIKHLQGINSAFWELVKDVGYPIREWDSTVVEEYLLYSINLLDLLNLISSSISRLGSSCLSLSHALSQVVDSPALAVGLLKPIVISGHGSYDGMNWGDGGDAKLCLDLGKSASGLLDSSIWKELIKRGAVVKEVKEVNDAVASLVAALALGDGDGESKELERKLKELEKLLESVEGDISGLFSQVMDRRNEVLDCHRLRRDQ
ncbi:hypothetical protein Dimus_023311 [Dionaea muscipula]